MNLNENALTSKQTLVSLSIILQQLGITQYQSLSDGFFIIQNGELFQLIKKEENDYEKKTSS